MNPATKPILEAASEFLWSDELQSSLDSFSTNHAPMFADATGVEGEQKLEWTQAHLDFQQLFEFQLEQFVESKGIPQEEFVAACQDALDHGSGGGGGTSPVMDPAGFSAWIVETVLMSTSYEYFVEAMMGAATKAGVKGQREPEPEDEGTELQDLDELAGGAE